MRRLKKGASFAGSLFYAVLAALASIPWLMASAPVLGTSWALGLYCLGAAIVYLAWIAPSWHRALAAGALACLGALPVALLAPMPAGAVMGAAAILAAVRSGFLYGGKPVRALMVEGALVGGGLVFARLFAGSSWLSLGAAFWGFFLLQSLYFLVGSCEPQRSGEPQPDPFEAARNRALALMAQRP